MSLISTPS